MATPEMSPASAMVVLNNGGHPPFPNTMSHDEKVARLLDFANELRGKFIEWAKSIDSAYDPDAEMGHYLNLVIPSFPVTNASVLDALKKRSQLPPVILGVTFFDAAGNYASFEDPTEKKEGC